jgi:hypothetical protein
MTSLEGFQHHLKIISKFDCCDLYMKKNVAYTLISFDILHKMTPFHLEQKLNLLDQNVNELEFELLYSRGLMRVTY